MGIKGATLLLKVPPLRLKINGNTNPLSVCNVFTLGAAVKATVTVANSI